MSLLLNGDGIEAWSYYDGYIFGMFQDQGMKHWFMIDDKSDEKMGTDAFRTYDAWVIDEFPDVDVVPDGWESPDGWLRPTRPPDKTVSEEFLIDLYAREEDG